MSISTKTGDDGTTSLAYGRRVSKSHPRVAAYGAVDELSSTLGLCRAHSGDEVTAGWLLTRQKELVMLMAELASDRADIERFSTRNREQLICGRHLAQLEASVTELESQLPPCRDWVLAGESPLQAYFDLARTVCRRAEREVVTLAQSEGEVRAIIIAYLNRLADILWLLGRKSIPN